MVEALPSGATLIASTACESLPGVKLCGGKDDSTSKEGENLCIAIDSGGTATVCALKEANSE